MPHRFLGDAAVGADVRRLQPDQRVVLLQGPRVQPFHRAQAGPLLHHRRIVRSEQPGEAIRS